VTSLTDFQNHPLKKILDNRIAIIDGAMGTTIRTYSMAEADIRGERFKNATKGLLNNGDLFVLTQPKIIGDFLRPAPTLSKRIRLARRAFRKASFLLMTRASMAGARTRSFIRRSSTTSF
jgi:hypothetical protein